MRKLFILLEVVLWFCAGNKAISQVVSEATALACGYLQVRNKFMFN
jgi:hypothetical protein